VEIALNSTSYTGNVTYTRGKPKQYDWLPDTPREEIQWEPMTAFVQYRENVEFSFGGKTWFCSSGSTKVKDSTETDAPPVWRFWAVATPYIFGSCNSQLARSQDVRVEDHIALSEAQEALLRAVRKEA
jgi:hypothetical protein